MREEMSVKILIGDVRERLRELPDESVHCVVTSPPYWGLRDYGVPGQLGLEATPEEHVRVMVEVFREVRRCLRSDGVLFLNYGDVYQGKQLLGMPWRIALALQADGWWLRSEIIWSKPNAMPESAKDRPTKSHEHLFLLAKSTTYHYDQDAVREPVAAGTVERSRYSHQYATRAHRNGGTPQSGGIRPDAIEEPPAGRNLRDVWTIPTEPFPGAHFATFPQALVEPCIKAGCPAGGTVLDPFAGVCTTLLVADKLGRNGIGIELNPEYAAMAERRITDDCPLFAEVEMSE